MSLLPLILRDMMSMGRPLRMLENHLRFTEELLQPFISSSLQRRYPEFEFIQQPEHITKDKEKFQIKLDVQHFAPEEIVVKTIDGNAIQIEAKHEKEGEKGFISRQLIRKFMLPNGHDIKDVISSLSSDGILTITAPRKVDPNVEETIIKIEHTGPERESEDKKPA